jgi:hypothetical protein
MRSMTRKKSSMRSSQRGTRCGCGSKACGSGADPGEGSDSDPDGAAELTVSAGDSDSGCWYIRLLQSAVPDVCSSQSLTLGFRAIDAKRQARREDTVLKRYHNEGLENLSAGARSGPQVTLMHAAEQSILLMSGRGDAESARRGQIGPGDRQGNA